MTGNIDGTANRPLVQSTISGFAWLLSSASFQHFIRLVVLMVLARLLSPADFGIISAATTVVYLAIIFSWIGVGPAIVQISILEPSHMRTGFSISVLFGLLVGGTVYLLAPAIAQLFRIPELSAVLRVLSIIFPISAFAVVSESLLRRGLQFHKLAAAEAISYGLCYGIIAIVLAWAGFGYWSLVGAVIAQHTLRTLLLTIMRPHPSRPQLSFRVSKDLFRFGAGLTIAQALNFLALQGDNFVVGRWLGASALGFYSRAYTMMSVPNKVLGETLNSVLFPAMARVQEEPQRLKNAFRRAIAGASLVTLPISVACCILAPEIVQVALGPGWDQVVPPFQILSLGMFFRTGYKMVGPVSQAVGAVYANAWRQGVYAFSIIAGAWIGQQWGIEGVALGVLGALLVMFAIMSQLGLKLTSLTLRELLQSYIPALRFAILLGGGLWGLVLMLRRNEFPALPILGISLTATLISCTFLLKWRRTFFLGVDGVWLYDAVVSFIRPKKALKGIHIKILPLN